VALGTAHLHALGILHRDINSQNVLLAGSATGGYTAKLGDFGCARLLVPPNPAESAVCGGSGCGWWHYEPAAISGTPGYMAPEQLAGVQYLSCGADVWALGILTHEILTGLYPWEVRNLVSDYARWLGGLVHVALSTKERGWKGRKGEG
jgi:serine/threonine protein kinase